MTIYVLSFRLFNFLRRFWINTEHVIGTWGDLIFSDGLFLVVYNQVVSVAEWLVHRQLVLSLSVDCRQVGLVGVLERRLHMHLTLNLVLLNKLIDHFVWLEGVFHDDLTAVELHYLVLLACHGRGLEYHRAELLLHRLLALHHYKA